MALLQLSMHTSGMCDHVFFLYVIFVPLFTELPVGTWYAAVSTGVEGFGVPGVGRIGRAVG